jgi:hypothetical protein
MVNKSARVAGLAHGGQVHFPFVLFALNKKK